jgi:replicative DNA helicase
VTVADQARPAAVGSGATQFDRTPPQDVEAERSVLGGMLLSKDAIADVVEVLRPGDYYYPANQLVHEAVLDLYARGDPADPITVSAELTRSGQLMRAGGATYLHTLVSSVPTAANAGYYAQIVAERAILRRLVTAGTRIVQMGYDTASGSVGVVGSVDAVVDRAQAEVYEVTERRSSEDYSRIEDLLQPTWDELEQIMDRGGVGTGIPTGFSRLDEITNGLHGGQMVTVAGRPGSGKALALDTPLVTPTGWTTMGAVLVGDCLIGADGRPTRVVLATQVMLGRRCYEVEFSDGSVIVADAEHQWRTTTSRGHGPVVTAEQIISTEQLADSLRGVAAAARPMHVVECTRAIELPERELPMAPYALGARLAAEATMTPDSTTAERDILDGSHAAHHIPCEYLRASESQRRALLAGLLDTSGVLGSDGNIALGTTGRRLAQGVRELAVSLGYRACVTSSQLAGAMPAPPTTCHTVTFTTPDPDFGPTREAAREIVAARRIESVPVRCVQVDNGDHMYLAGRSMIPTHNSTLALDFARSAAVRHSKPTVIFSLEMGKLEIMMRLLSAEASVPLASMRSGHLNDQDWQRMARRSAELSEAPLFVDDSPNLTMMEIRAKARRLRQRNDLQLIVIDYLQLMTSGKRVESRQQEVSEFSRAIKLLAKELELPVVALSQLNRGSEQRQDKRPMLADLRESGSIEQDSDLVLLVHREDMYEPESPRAGEADLIIAKHRNGPTATVAVAFQGRYSRFSDMPQ